MSSEWRAARPASDEYAGFYDGYIQRAPAGDVVDTLGRQLVTSVEFYRSIPEARAGHRYAPGKWSIREVLGHVCDAERVFTYRAMRIARGDTTPLPGFDENLYVDNARFDERTMEDLIAEFENVRRSSISLFGALDEEEFLRRGTASNHGISVRALAFITAGHGAHHIEVIRARYLPTG